MTYSYYILLYTAIYDFCTQNKPHVTTFGAGARGGASLQGADLYRSLHGFLSEHCKNLREVRQSWPESEVRKRSDKALCEGCDG
jgi:cullin 1